MQRRILLADNNLDFLETSAEFLEGKGYSVWKASNTAEALRVLSEEWVHLAVLDVRLEDDDDEKDKSGLTLARTAAPSVPKIVLTGFPTYQDVRAGLRPFSGSRPAVDYLAKDDGLEGLLGAIEEVFAQRVRINEELVIEFGSDPASLLYVINLIEPGLAGERLLSRRTEFEELIRRVFYDYDQIKMDRLFWQRGGIVALSVFAFAEGKSCESLMIHCGLHQSLIEESQRYKKFAPKVTEDTGTALIAADTTTHYSANVFSLQRADLEETHSLSELYQTQSEKIFNAAINTLFRKTLAAWHREKRIVTEDRLDQLYRRHFESNTQMLTRQILEERVQSLVRQIPTLGPKIERGAGRLTIRFDKQSFSYRDPIPFICHTSGPTQLQPLMNTPGVLTGDNILADSCGHAWVTDFAAAGPAPLLWNYVALEATIRFDWSDAKQLQWVHHMEQHLINGEFSKLYVSDFEPTLRKPLKAIQTVRRLASRTVGRDLPAYHCGILFEGVRRLLDFKPELKLTPKVLARLTHALLATAMISDLMETKPANVPKSGTLKDRGIRIDRKNRVVWIDGTRIALHGHGYELLLSLAEHPHQLCTRSELVERVFKEKHDERNESQTSRLNTAIHRLRKQLEDDPLHPRFLITEQGNGYRLILQPEE